ncbi:hypothetical protein [Lactobacillus helveticus]|uniref:Uncharacterized protein n=1 Tax=Lactobacillus helveticus TaxID=1587 RepID=A0A2X0R950_LACHE|nr:hypothetical protein [Lactobacillus helveticus]GFP10274.1 hypothetical protein LHEJCM1007_03830 [Lactobacillus helveticus]GFP13970.1 hypothetical protein LHEJCM1062_18420 [Lactobacillus helveticus]SPS13423.1 hypothetical protein BDKNPLJD_00217 [Lactobacillus helveticus]
MNTRKEYRKKCERLQIVHNLNAPTKLTKSIKIRIMLGLSIFCWLAFFIGLVIFTFS